MAAMRGTVSPFDLILLVLATCSITIESNVQIPGKEYIAEKWTKKIDASLTEFTEVLTKMIENEYRKAEPYVKFEYNDGTRMVAKMSADLEKMLGKKMEALKRVVDEAEEAVKKHDFNPNLKWDPDIKKSDVQYWDAKDEQQLGGILAYNDRFLQPINDTVSTVHIPVEIFKGNIEILNGLKWSSDLDKVFRKNYEEDPDILWQYFGSQTGFMRTFPGSKWSMKEKEVDLFDVRRRPWYTQGSSSPKDMFILIDTSGSVHGQALSLIRVAVKSILDTLGENDFVNIAHFSKTVQFVSCFTTFVQANYRNKKILSENVSHIEANEMADFENALSFAFDQFDKFDNSSKSGANCNRMIMLLTDGGTDEAQEVFKKRNFNRPEKDQIRVFTYAVGQTANPSRGIKWMACANRGKFSEIPAMGAIRARVQGLGMMTTVTLPVYNKTDNEDIMSNQTILGVMGTDVTTKQMEKYSPVWKLGPSGYSFAINANGYIMFHPRLRIHDDFKDPPNMDFLDIEVENTKKTQLSTVARSKTQNFSQLWKLRKNMTDGHTGDVKMETYVISVDNNHTDLELRHYFYTNITNTSFSLGMSIPSYQEYTVAFTNTTENLVKDGNIFQGDSLTAMLIAKWDYCVNMTTRSNLSGRVRDIYNVYKDWENKNKPAGFWDDDRLLHLYWDIKKTQNLGSFLNDIAKMTNVSVYKTEASFIATYGGLTRIYPANSKHVKRLEQDSDTWKASYFKRALDYNGYIFSAPYTLTDRSENDTVPDVMVVKSITIEKKNIKPAVVGGFVKHEKIFNLLITQTEQHCQEDSNTTCYLLDDGAFMITSNQRDQLKKVGMFLGHVDPVLMHELYNKSSYMRLDEFDYQATCSKNDGIVSSAVRLRVPSFNFLFELLTFNWWTTFWTWSVSNWSLYRYFKNSWLYPPVVEAATQPDDSENCIKKLAQYYIPKDFTDISGTIYCRNNCTRDYVAIKLNNSNLMFVIAGQECPRCAEDKSGEMDLIQEPQTFPDSEEREHFCTQKPRYRRVTENCYDFHEKENHDDCSGPLSTPVSVAVIVIATVITIIFTWIR